MVEKTPIESPLQARTVAVPESRQLDILADLFERRGAHVIRTPLVTILDSPDVEKVEAWLRDFISQRPDYFIILTGEGLRRLCGFAERSNLLAAFIAALQDTVKICRGPKPGRALREIGLAPDILGSEPTTQGIIDTLQGMDLQGKRIAVQLYGEEPNLLLQNYLAARESRFTTVAPYVYAPQSDTLKVLELIHQLIAGTVDVIAFTSQPQLQRLLAVAGENQLESQLLCALQKTRVAAVGPVVAAQLGEHGIPVAAMPQDAFFMKPLVREIEKILAST